MNRWIPALLGSAILGAYTYDVIAQARFEPRNFAPPANLRGIKEPTPALFEPSTAPPQPSIDTATHRAPVSVAELDGFQTAASTQSLNNSLPTAVGRIPSSHGVSPTGSAAYTIPIWTPPGARGIEPRLALAYSSARPDGLLGTGWSLNGLSNITRCARTWEQDGTPGAVALTMSDKFCLDGNRLRNTGGTYGAAGSTYQTEIETFGNVVAHDVAGDGPAWFEVKGKDGLIYEYGNTTDSRVPEAGPTPYLWALNKVRDRQGNNLVITYEQSNGSFRPTSIRYTQTPATGAEYHYEVAFDYILRATGTYLYSFVAGNEVQEQRLMSSVRVQSDGVLVRQYNLDYTTGPVTQRGRLSAVQECTATDCLRPTTITYQDGEQGIASVSTSAGTGATSGKVGTHDINGDGRMDLVFATLSGSTYTWWVKFASSAGFGTAVNTGVATSAADPVVFDDFDANGAVDLLARSGGVWFVLKWTGSSFIWTSTGTVVDPHTQFVSADVNGDGLPDLVSFVVRSVYTRLNATTGGSISFSPTATLAYQTAGELDALWGNNQHQSAVRRLDFDGDGRDDVAIRPYGFNLIQLLLSRGSTFLSGEMIFAGTLGVPVAWNDDRCTDLAMNGELRIAGCNGQAPASVWGVYGVVLAADWDADGHMDILADTDSNGVLEMYRSTGNGAAAPVSTGIPKGNGYWLTFDQNGDGLDDLAFADANAANAVTYGLHHGANAMPDLATSITDGFEMNVTFDYKSMAAWDDCYERDSAPPTFPTRAFVGPIYVACTLTASNGSGGTYQVSNSYYNSNLHLQGRGWVGFERRYVIDNRDAIVNMDVYGQTFPHIGMPLYRLARQSDWVTKIRETTNTPSSLAFGSGYDTRRFPYVSQSVIDVFEVGGNLNGQWIKRTTSATVPDNFGNPATVTTTVVDKSTASPWFGDTYTTQTVNTITNDTGNWCLGLATQTAVTSTLPDNTSQTRTFGATPDYLDCRYTQTVIEPASNTLRVTTNYGFDPAGCGNVTGVTVIGKKPDGTDMPARTTTGNFGTRCQFAESITNALGQPTQRAYRYDLGLVSSETDPNGITVSWLYDGYGRKTQENRPDGTATVWSYGFCDSSNGYCGAADLRWSVSQYDYDTTLGQIRYRHVFNDGFDRVRYDGGLNLAGALTWNAIVGYDARGNRWYQYNPYSIANNGYASFTYDLINRPIVSALYASSGAWDRQSLTAYVGQVVTFTDPKGNVNAEYRDVRGNVRRVEDPAPGGTTHYTWDPFGNLLTTTDPIGAGSTVEYDVRGFKRALHDTDTGSWSYTPNSLGEVVSQTDANLRTTTFVFDQLGRMTSRTELEGTSNFNWGHLAADKNIGKLESVSGPGYSEIYTYDSIGRPATTTYNADTDYHVDYAYNAYTGELDNVTYPTSTASYRLRAQYLYTNGILNQIRDFNAPATVWWQLNAEDDRGYPIDEQLKNGVHALSHFDGMTGHPDWRTSGNNAQFNNHQNVTFEWDKNENLERRIDVNQSSLTERFFYDTLDRVDYSTLNGVTNLDVGLDAAGNILSKTSTTEPLSNVGNYTYHSVKRHAVASTSNGWSFTYDANGNMLTGRGATITWYSYNLPNTVINGSLTSQFFYTPDGAYWRQNANHAAGSENTIYIGGLVEKVSSPTGTQYRHMIRAGTTTVIVSRHTNGTNETYYATQDHIGSTAVVTKNDGTVLVNENSGAFGNRRGSNWQGSPSTADWTAIAGTTRRGFTDHTMADNLTLIHMNGRMYDPLLGRFISADPFVQAPYHSQSLNRYSYVWNNPVTLTDPSGFCGAEGEESCLLWKCMLGQLCSGVEPGRIGFDDGFMFVNDLTDDEKRQLAESAPPLQPGEQAHTVFQAEFWELRKAQLLEANPNAHCGPIVDNCDYFEDGILYSEDRHGRWGFSPPIGGVGNTGKGIMQGTLQRVAGRAAAAGTRSATTAFGRSIESLKDSLSSSSGVWTQVAAHAEPATAKAYRGGTSIEQLFVNRETGERIVYHSIVRGDELLKESFRPYAKFGID